MTENAEQDPTPEAAAQAARIAALRQRRAGATSRTTPAAKTPTGAKTAQLARQKHAASGARVLVTGLAVGGGLAMVGAMAAASAAQEVTMAADQQPAVTQTTTIHRVVVPRVIPAATGQVIPVQAEAPAPEVIKRVVTIEQAVPVAAPQTTSGGS